MKDSDLKKHLEPSLYRILCVDRNATSEQIKQSFRGMQMVFHPDKNKDDQAWATEKSSELNFAYTVLSNSTYKPNSVVKSYKGKEGFVFSDRLKPPKQCKLKQIEHGMENLANAKKRDLHCLTR